MKNKNIYIGLILLFILTLFSQQLLAAEVRNPFMDYKLSGEFSKEENTLEMVKSDLPFKLLGIISSSGDRMAIISTADGETKFIKGSFKKDDYKLLNIGEDRVLISYHDLRIYMEIGGDLIAAGN